MAIMCMEKNQNNNLKDFLNGYRFLKYLIEFLPLIQMLKGSKIPSSLPQARCMELIQGMYLFENVPF